MHRSSLAFANFITDIFVTAIFQNNPEILGFCNIWLIPTTAILCLLLAKNPSNEGILSKIALANLFPP